MTPEERLIAYIDGELSPADTLAFEAETAANLGLAAQVDRHRRLQERLSAAYDPALEAPMPLKLVAAIRRPSPPAATPLPRWAALAACLVVGLGSGLAVNRPSGPLANHDGQLVARGGLARALESGLAADPGPVRLGVSFKSQDGRYCRTFQSPADQLAGLACRDQGRWVAAVTARTPLAAPTGYRQAASETPPAVLAAVDSMIAAGPLDAAAERRARDSRWK